MDKIEYFKKRTNRTTHNRSNTKLYTIYHKIKERTKNANYKGFKDYGGRGIKMCNEWLSDFMKFYNWAINNGYEHGLSIERINVNKGYNPDNCTWIPMKEQARNKRTSLRNRFTEEELSDAVEFYENTKYSQRKIAKLMNISQKSFVNLTKGLV